MTGQRLEGPGSDARLKRVQQRFRDASRGFRIRALAGRWWPLLVLIAAAAVFVAWQRFT